MWHPTLCTGSPQGCVLSPWLYILYTYDCCIQHDNRLIIKFADDSVIVSLLNTHENAHGPVIDDFVSWCEDAFLHLNISKTKDMSIDFRRLPPALEHTVIMGEDGIMLQVSSTLIDDWLKFDLNTTLCARESNKDSLPFGNF